MTANWRDRVRSRLRELGLPMKVASLRAGRGETWVRDILERNQTPSTANFEALARALETTVADLLSPPPGLSEAEQAAYSGGGVIIPVMGYVGAGGEISVDGEQPPPDGFDQVEVVDLSPREPMVAFVVRGDSMFPSYEPGEVIVCYREQRRDADWFLGRRDAVVRTAEGNRYLKRIAKGRKPGAFTLYSTNAEPIEDVRIAWVGEIYASIRPEGVRHVARPASRGAGRKQK